MPRGSQKTQQSRPKKKYQRSQSPTAKEKRKIQNRIAQQNHRRRMKEQSNNSSDEQTNNQSSVSDRPMASTASMDGLSSSMEATPINAPSHPLPVASLDPMLDNLSASVAFQPDLSLFMFSSPESCTCNPMTELCLYHLDEMQFKMMMDAVSNPAPNVFSVTAPPLVDPALSAVTIDQDNNSTFMLDTASLPPSPLLKQRRSESSSARSMPSTQSHRVENRTSHRSRSSTSSSKTSSQQSLSSSTDRPNSTSPTYSLLSTRSSPMVLDEPVSHNTARFTKILATCREAEFTDFDSMASTYYTCTLEKSSVPEMAQRASRSRHLPRVMQNLHANSKTWPRYESRGIHEAATEHAKSVYEEELQEVTRGLDERMQADNLSTLHERRRNPGGSEKDRAMAQLTSLPEDVEMVVQDKAPRLWSLLTELAGPESLYCDKVSHAVVALLIKGRQSQWNN
ncbi:hypothetical protein HBH70_147300 [Parastagonospora nodorum]|nr:hypothetical protein HBH49_174330 [Parastagonospora nodorum]KAH4076054.1 hypothetical protein HBH50_025030 [Parastagonospora nodorum]KAH4097643.1 hypothetical protein HBH48_022270 [Parastagonospora nodorum]KAH4123012.1 hypothetical protein HBH45_246820 [Parastagonospora nodorum]KAH4126059.1 hypothetical protein HBH47_051800 [Parastagonospora nodorum]